MDIPGTPYRVRPCSKCQGDTNYYCVSCQCNMCPQCKEDHLKKIKTIDHNVVSYHDKINYILTQEICLRHPRNVYTKYCEPCQVPVCNYCSEDQSHTFRSFLFGQSKHTILDIQGAYKTKHQQHRGTIHSIRSEALFYRPVFWKKIKTDVKTCHTELLFYESELLAKARTLKHFIDKGLRHVDFKHRCLKQKMKMYKSIVRLQRYIYSYEQSAFTFSALQFLSSIKTALPKIHISIHTSQLSMTESLNKEDVIEALLAVQITERGNRRVGKQYLLKLLSGAEIHQSFTVTGVDGCYHISCQTSDHVWISDYNNLILTNTTGDTQHRVDDSISGLLSGTHTVNSEGELIYIQIMFNINKLSKDMKKPTTFIERTDSTWRPQCIYCSPSSGDLLVGMYRKEPWIGKVTRYNQRGQLTQTIQHDNTGLELYSEPRYITENNNGNVVVSDYIYYRSGAVVVTTHGGKHRFSYTGNPSISQLEPRGVCTDALSNILVCDGRTKTVHIIDRDGQFLSYLRTSQRMGIPWSLSYDFNTHRLSVGSYSNKMCVYMYITRQDALTDEHSLS